MAEKQVKTAGPDRSIWASIRMMMRKLRQKST
jgi:hypothetical protein